MTWGIFKGLVGAFTQRKKVCEGCGQTVVTTREKTVIPTNLNDPDHPNVLYGHFQDCWATLGCVNNGLSHGCADKSSLVCLGPHMKSETGMEGVRNGLLVVGVTPLQHNKRLSGLNEREVFGGRNFKLVATVNTEGSHFNAWLKMPGSGDFWCHCEGMRRPMMKLVHKSMLDTFEEENHFQQFKMCSVVFLEDDESAPVQEVEEVQQGRKKARQTQGQGEVVDLVLSEDEFDWNPSSGEKEMKAISSKEIVAGLKGMTRKKSSKRQESKKKLNPKEKKMRKVQVVDLAFSEDEFDWDPSSDDKEMEAISTKEIVAGLKGPARKKSPKRQESKKKSNPKEKRKSKGQTPKQTSASSSAAKPASVKKKDGQKGFRSSHMQAT